ncbi:HAD-IIB family hydrolase [Geminocystis sp.]|uniref:HAD-IIB family hydrolase n=1 Tax=Geminocystis sp. TaxID=2664100 RepID=UPI003594625C
MTNIMNLLICTDLDRTLIPNGKSPESPCARALFHQLVAHENIFLAYVTGRDQNLVKNAMENYHLPSPNFVISDVGSSIYKIVNNQWLRITDWDQKIQKDWGNFTREKLSTFLIDINECKLQEKEKQGLSKLSYYIPLKYDHKKLLKKIKLRLEEVKIKSNLIWSVDEEKNIGLLDILPKSANKYQAINYVMNKEKFTLENTVFAGDSGNDLDVLVSPIKSILVANAHEEIKNIIQKMQLQETNNIYIAEGKYLNLNGNYSAGILEGIVYYFPNLIPLLTVKI